MVYDRDPTLRSSRASAYAPGADEGVELRGTVGSSVASGLFRFKTAEDSNVVVKVVEGDPPRVEIGVYYV